MGTAFVASAAGDAWGGALLLLQGIPEIFRAFHQMGKDRERLFLWALPIYLIALIWLTLAVFAPDMVPGGIGLPI